MANPTEFSFAQVEREPSLPDRVVSEMLEAISSGELRPGDKLATERELGDQFGVSRTVIREAVRSLVAKGVLEVKPRSGLSVAAVTPEGVREIMGLYLQGQLLAGDLSFGYEKIHEVRTVLELRVVELACERADDAEIRELERLHSLMESAGDDAIDLISGADLDFHSQLARMTHNELFPVVFDSLSDILLWVRRKTLQMPGRLEVALQQHSDVLDAIKKRDPELARAAMVRHLEDSQRISDLVLGGRGGKSEGMS